MTVLTKIKIRNIVAKHNRHRAVAMKVRTQYQRQPKHKAQYEKETFAN
jgi:hypothetical protein